MTAQVWTSYWGELLRDEDGNNKSVLYGFENVSSAHIDNQQAVITEQGACFGFVASGSVLVQDDCVSWTLMTGQWFSVPNGLRLNLSAQTRVVVAQSLAYQGVHAMGGPIEALGRLRYIDGCSDSLLCAPPLLGDPCLNHLHFPAGIQQTAHTHPSLRAGIIARGYGVCEANQQQIILSAGDLFHIPKECEHRFITDNCTMDVIAYHPDSDWGPTHDEHPMVNRTWVDGHKIDNHAPQHQAAFVVRGR